MLMHYGRKAADFMRELEVSDKPFAEGKITWLTRANPDRSAPCKAGGGRGLQPPAEASIRNGSAAVPLAGSRGAAPSPTRCLQRNSRSVLRYFGNGA